MNQDEVAHLRMLAEEYVALVMAMRSGAYDDDSEYRELSSQRTIVHDELIAITGLTDRHAMFGYCRQLLSVSAIDSTRYDDLPDEPGATGHLI